MTQTLKAQLSHFPFVNVVYLYPKIYMLEPFSVELKAEVQQNTYCKTCQSF